MKLSTTEAISRISAMTTQRPAFFVNSAQASLHQVTPRPASTVRACTPPSLISTMSVSPVLFPG
jgi:hypothetical protein